MSAALKHEVSILEEMRVATADIVVDDVTLLRFLRARDMDIKRAGDMLRKSLEWRESNRIETITKWTVPDEIAKDFRMYFTGLDDRGFPVLVVPLGKWNSRSILGKGLKEESVRYMYKTLELIMDKCESLGVSKFTIIIDNEGLSLWKCAHWDSIENTIRVIKDFEANYPETLLNAFLVNTPSVFWQAFKFVKPILAANTLAKIHIFDTDKNKWKGALLEKIPQDALPNAYGGNAQALDVHS